MRARVVLGAAAGTVLMLSGCGTSRVSHGKLESGLGTTFANLYVLQQRDRGRTVHADALRTRAACSRGATPSGGVAAPKGSGSGAGENWICLVNWLVDADAPVQAQFTLEVKANGCFVADGDGPTEINGQQTLVTPDGKTIPNPLWRFDGCLDPTWGTTTTDGRMSGEFPG